MRVLLLLSESWNDQLVPNNNMTNWFLDFPDIEIWTISGSGEKPANRCCKDYFMISERKMLKSFWGKGVAGEAYHCTEYPVNYTIQTSKSHKKIKKMFSSEIVRLARDFVWRFGKYNYDELQKFILACNPDIIFTQRRGSIKMCRMEKIVSEYTNAPMVAYTGDDEYSLHQFSLSPVFWIRRFWVRSWLKKQIPQYKLFYSQSERQMKEFQREFGVQTKFLVKCGNFDEKKSHQTINDPIQLVYAGKLYCHRWKTLAMIAKAIKAINEKNNAIRMQLNIYTADEITPKQQYLLNDGMHSIIHGSVSSSVLPNIYKNNDIILHVESFDKKNRLLTQDSFSTKVIDCMSSGCAVMAVCWEGHAAYQYLKERNAAIVARSYEEVYKVLSNCATRPEHILMYAKKAYICGVQNHSREQIQREIYDDFRRIIEQC